jgi:hypothetical protein
MEKIMNKTNETFGDHDTLADSELGAVTGGWGWSFVYRAPATSSVGGGLGDIKGEQIDDHHRDDIF